jgi:hypothetical protein
MDKDDLTKILDSLVFLNMKELKTICDKFNIFYNIFIEHNNNVKKTNEVDHKETIINNITFYLKKNKIPKKTLYKRKIINYEKINNIKKDDKIYYGQYKTTNKNILKLLKELTDNKFKFGAISQKIIRKLWKNNELITYEDFANLWEKEYNKGDINYPELAYIQFMKKHGSTKEWFKNKENILKIFKKHKIL